MGILSGLEPAEVFRFFEEICAIPHGSGNTEQISDHCVKFAQSRSLRYVRDSANNVIIYKDGTAGYENSAPVIIQGHLDMVCEKTAECDISFETDGLRLRAEDDFVYAEGTTLGGDDGIAVAYALALLDSDDIPHPPLEAVFTTDEEVGMLGAAALDCSLLRSRIMINIDSESEGCLLVSCAGGVCADCVLPLKRGEKRGVYARLLISGLLGGHSGTEINKGRANSNRLMGRALNELGKAAPFSLISVNGGMKDNAIPRETSAEILVDAEDTAALKEFAARYNEIFSREYSVTDPQLSFTAELGGEISASAMDEDSKERAIFALLHLPGGVQRMSADIGGLVQTSLNMGILQTRGEELFMSFSVRSSIGSEKAELVSRIESMMKRLGGSVSLTGDYPAWEYRRDSKLRRIMSDVYKSMYGKEPEIQAIHAGLECGIFAGALEGLDCVSCGPDIFDIHTVNERLSVSSAARMWRFLVETLRELK